MAQTYEQWKKSYEGMTSEQQKQYNDILKTKGADYIGNQYMSQYNGSSTPTTNKTSKVITTPTSNTGNQWSATNYKDSDGYYSGTERNAATAGAEFGRSQTSTPVSTPVSTPTTPTTPTTRTTPVKTQTGGNVRDYWNSLSPEQQQKVSNTEKGKAVMKQYGLTLSGEPAKTETAATPTTPTTPTTGGGWDYQDNSPERMKQMADNVNGFAQSDPWIFNSEDSYRKFFIDGKGRTPEQEAFLMDLYKNRKTYNDLDNYTADEIGAMDVNGRVPESYLNYLKNSDPERYAMVMDAIAKEKDKIKDQADMDSISNIAGDTSDEDTTWGKMMQWMKDNGFLVDANGDLIDDRRYHEASEEEKTYAKEYSDNLARIMELQQTKRDVYDDYVKAYPGATKATLLAMTNDATTEIQKEIDNLTVENTRLQGYVSYAQDERQQYDQAGADTIGQLEDLMKYYYTYSPEGMSEYLQAQYAAANVTLDQADNGTDTQKQMALDSILTPIYEQYGNIIERPKAQVINDIMAYANKNGISLSQALQENFIMPLKNKDAYKAYQASLSSSLSNGSWTLEPIKDAKGNITGYVRVNKDTGEVVPYSGMAGAGTGVYNENTGVYNYADAFGYANQNKLGSNLGYKNNNPGNITDSNVGEIGRNGKFAVFETPEDGFDALMQKIQNAQNGLSKNYPATSNLYEFFNTYAPASDNNDPKKYAESVAAQLGVSPYTKIKDLDTFQFAAQIARHDSGYDASTYGMFRGNEIGGVEDHSDNPARSPMYDAIQTVLDSGDLSSTQLQNLQLADIIYRQFYNLASDGSLDHFIESSNFQNIMSQLSKRDFTKAGNDEGASFLKYWKKAIEKEGITDQTNLRVIRVLTEMIEKKLRKESGAAISSSEWLSNFENYMPQAGESRENKLSTMLDWELNIIEPSMRYSGVKDYKWLFSKNSPYYKTEGQSGNYYDMNANSNNTKGTWDIGVGSVTQTPSTSGGQFSDLFTMLQIG